MKVTKAVIIKELKEMKETQISLKNKDNGTKLLEFQNNLILSNYKDRIESIMSKVNEIMPEYDNLVNDLSNDKDIELYCYRNSSTLMFNLNNLDQAVRTIRNNANFKKGKFSVEEHRLVKEKLEIEYEWDKLITYCKSLPMKELRKYLEDNKIELECIKNEGTVTTTALVVQDINFNKLFGGNHAK